MNFNNIISIKKNSNVFINSNLKFSVLALNINGCLNIGNMMRTSNLNGVDKFFIFGHKKYDKRSAMSVYKYINVIRVNENFPNGINENNSFDIVNDKTKINLSEQDLLFNEKLFIDTMNNYNLIPIFIEQSNESIYIDRVNWKDIIHNIPDDKSICFIFGSEFCGIPKNIIDSKKYFPSSVSIQIRQTGVINSYNVSNCASIILNSFYNFKLNNVINKYDLFV